MISVFPFSKLASFTIACDMSHTHRQVHQFSLLQYYFMTAVMSLLIPKELALKSWDRAGFDIKFELLVHNWVIFSSFCTERQRKKMSEDVPKSSIIWETWTQEEQMLWNHEMQIHFSFKILRIPKICYWNNYFCDIFMSDSNFVLICISNALHKWNSKGFYI